MKKRIFSGDLRIEDLALTLPINGVKNIDLKRVSFIYPSAITAITSYVYDELRKGRKVEIELPAGSSGISSYLKRIKFDTFTGSRIELELTEKPQEGRFTELTLIDSFEKKEKFINELEGIFSQYLPVSVTGEILSSTPELIENVLLHSGEHPWCIAMAQKYRSNIEVSISDRGIGIRKSLERNRDLRIPFDALALQLAVRKGITRDSAKFAGEGLWRVKNFAVNQRGFFWIWSGNGFFTATPWTQGAGKVPGYWHGTSVGFYFKKHE